VVRKISWYVRHSHTYQSMLQRGRDSERIVEEALRRLKAEGKINHWFKWDRHGVDYVLETSAGKQFLQVKSSWKGEFFHAQQYPQIPSVVLSGGTKNQRAFRRQVEKAKRMIVGVISGNAGKHEVYALSR